MEPDETEIFEMEQLQNLEGSVMLSHIEASEIERGAGYRYTIESLDPKTKLLLYEPIDIKFQCGNPADGVNGIREEDLLTVMIHRAECFHHMYSTTDSQAKLDYLKATLQVFNRRAQARIDSGVQGDITKKEIPSG